jgi:hypothetical protein
MEITTWKCDSSLSLLGFLKHSHWARRSFYKKFTKKISTPTACIIYQKKKKKKKKMASR